MSVLFRQLFKMLTVFILTLKLALVLIVQALLVTLLVFITFFFIPHNRNCCNQQTTYWKLCYSWFVKPRFASVAGADCVSVGVCVMVQWESPDPKTQIKFPMYSSSSESWHFAGDHKFITLE